jgi:hypothetical protein
MQDAKIAFKIDVLYFARLRGLKLLGAKAPHSTSSHTPFERVFPEFVNSQAIGSDHS